MRKLILAAAVAVLAAPAFAQPAAPKAPKDRTLKAGKYTANATALACAACVDEIEKTLKGFKELDEVAVKQETSGVAFTVKPGAKVKLSKLQKALKAASDNMGMGADYTLKDLKALKS